jgi:paraquat-inducible protein B
MARLTNHYKLGLFVIMGVAAAIVVGLLVGGAHYRTRTIKYHSYFNESVQGLELGSPVKFRGVSIGTVSVIDIAPDHRMVDVVSELDIQHVIRMGLTEAGHQRGAERFAIPPDLRLQLNSQGITGVKYIAMDFFDMKSNPPPPLPFSIRTDHYIPAASSMLKNLEDTVTKAMERLPEMVDAVIVIMQRVDRLFATLESQDVSGKAVATLSHADSAMATLQSTMGRIDRQDLGAKSAGVLADLSVATNKLNEVLDGLGGQQGLIASARRATDEFGEVGRASRSTQKSLDATLRDLSEAAESIRALADALQRDPDMLLKGKAKGKGLR